MREKISLPQCAILFGLTYNVFYQRLKNKRYNYPKIHYDNNTPFVYKDEAELRAKQEKDFFSTHISVYEASQKLFGNKKTLISIRYYRPYAFLPLMVNYGRSYINKADFEDFYKNSCSSSRLIRLKKILNAVGMHNSVNFYYLLESTGFYQKVRSFVFCKNGKKYYNLADVNAWLKELGLKTIR